MATFQDINCALELSLLAADATAAPCCGPAICSFVLWWYQI